MSASTHMYKKIMVMWVYKLHYTIQFTIPKVYVMSSGHHSLKMFYKPLAQSKLQINDIESNWEVPQNLHTASSQSRYRSSSKANQDVWVPQPDPKPEWTGSWYWSVYIYLYIYCIYIDIFRIVCHWVKGKYSVPSHMVSPALRTSGR